MKRSSVIGQTGTTLLSDDSIQRRATRARTVRYIMVRKSARRIELSVCSPEHSRMYGVTVYGSTQARAEIKLKVVLANDYRYFGGLICASDKTPKLTRADAERAGGYRELANDVVKGAII